MKPETRFQHVVAAFAAEPVLAPIAEQYATRDLSKGFGGNALKVKEKIFAMLVAGLLVVKLPKARVNDMVDAGQGERFDPGNGRVMKEWLSLTADVAWLPLVMEAHAFVGGARKRPVAKRS